MGHLTVQNVVVLYCLAECTDNLRIWEVATLQIYFFVNLEELNMLILNCLQMNSPGKSYVIFAYAPSSGPHELPKRIH